MKKIEAIIKPHKTEDVREALSKLGILGITVTDARGFGRQKGHAELHRQSEYQVNFMPKVKMEIVVQDAQVRGAIDAIIESAQSGQVGDGKIFVTAIEQAVRIRTGERGEEAL